MFDYIQNIDYKGKEYNQRWHQLNITLQIWTNKATKEGTHSTLPQSKSGLSPRVSASLKTAFPKSVMIRALYPWLL